MAMVPPFLVSAMINCICYTCTVGFKMSSKNDGIKSYIATSDFEKSMNIRHSSHSDHRQECHHLAIDVLSNSYKLRYFVFDSNLVIFMVSINIRLCFNFLASYLISKLLVAYSYNWFVISTTMFTSHE